MLSSEDKQTSDGKSTAEVEHIPSAPPSFVQCETCSRLFGSRSISFHRRSCLQRSTVINAPTDAKCADRRIRRARQPASTRQLDRSLAEVDERRNCSHQLNIDSSSQPTKAKFSTRATMSKKVTTGMRKSRPRTATLKKPIVLKMSPYSNMDMSLTRCKELIELISLNQCQTSETTNTANSESEPILEESNNDGSCRVRTDRPKTIILKESSRDLRVPIIDSQLPVGADDSDINKQKGFSETTNILTSRKRLPNFTRALEQLLQSTARARLSTPPPLCSSCDITTKSERLHSHPGLTKTTKKLRSHKKRLSAPRQVAVRRKNAPRSDSSVNDNPGENECARNYGHSDDSIGNIEADSTEAVIQSDEWIDSTADKVTADTISINSVAGRKQKLEQAHRERQQKLQEDYCRKEERSKKARQEALRKKLAFAVANYGKKAPAKQTNCHSREQKISDSSIKFHQKHCQQADDSATNDEVKNETSGDISPLANTQHQSTNHRPRKGGTKLSNSSSKTAEPNTQLCFVCKLRFSVAEIDKHEDECLKRWKEQQRLRGPDTPTQKASTNDTQSETTMENKSETGDDKTSVTLGKRPKHRPTKNHKQEGTSQSPKSTTKTSRKNDIEEEHRDDNSCRDHVDSSLDILIDCAWDSHKNQLIPCPKCGRTFFPDRLPKHKSICAMKAAKKR